MPVSSLEPLGDALGQHDDQSRIYDKCYMDTPLQEVRNGGLERLDEDMAKDNLGRMIDK